MATYITLLNFTDQGARNVRETTERERAFREVARKQGVRIRETFWTLGRFDVVSIVEADDDVAATALLLAVGEKGNVRTETLRAFSAEEMGAILGKLPPKVTARRRRHRAVEDEGFEHVRRERTRNETGDAR